MVNNEKNEKNRYLNNVNHNLNNQYIFVVSILSFCGLLLLILLLWFSYVVPESYNLNYYLEQYGIKKIIGFIYVIIFLNILVQNIISLIQLTWINKLKNNFGEKQFKNFKNVRATYITNSGFILSIICIMLGLIPLSDPDDNKTPLFTKICFVLSLFYFIVNIIVGFFLALKHLYKKNPVLEEIE